MMGDAEVNTAVYTFGDYAVLLVLILSTVLIMISAIAIVSAFAKTVKEATTWVTPLMIVVMLIAVSSMIPSFRPTTSVMYLIPLYNSVQSMNGIFSFNFNTGDIIISVVSNLVYATGLIIVLTRMFSSEKVMFAK
jgi:sodium transport system permease protein